MMIDILSLGMMANTLTGLSESLPFLVRTFILIIAMT